MKRKTYSGFYDFIQDCAQIFHNAKIYNQTGSDIFNYALELEKILQAELVKLKDAGKISEKEAALPDLGPLPEPSDPENSEENSAVEDADEDAEEEEEEEDEDDEDDDDDEGKRKRRKKYNKSLRTGSGDVAVSRENSQIPPTANGVKSMNPRRKRGRPPRVDTPMEMRIKNVIKGLRRVKDDTNNAKIKEFDKLPDTKAEPGYYNTIAHPISVEMVKVSLRNHSSRVRLLILCRNASSGANTRPSKPSWETFAFFSTTTNSTTTGIARCIMMQISCYRKPRSLRRRSWQRAKMS